MEFPNAVLHDVPYPVRGLLIRAASPAISYPEQKLWRQVYKKLDEDNWIEDYGDHFLMKFYFTEVSEDRIVMERYPFAQSSVHVTKTIFEMKDADNGQVELSIREKVTKGDFVRKITKVIENHDQNDTYYMDLITRIQKYCAKRK